MRTHQEGVDLKRSWNTDMNYDFPQIRSVYEGMKRPLWEGFTLGKSNVCDLRQSRGKLENRRHMFQPLLCSSSAG